MLSVYADGSSSGRSDKPGGYGWVILRDGAVIRAGYGGDESTTNNRMELMGAIMGLRALKTLGLPLEGVLIELVSDSMYTLGIANGAYNISANVDLATTLRDLYRELGARTRWVKGHAVDPWNHRVDSLAKKGKLEAKATLEQKWLAEARNK